MLGEILGTLIVQLQFSPNIMDTNELLRRYLARERNFQGANLRKINLIGAELNGADLIGADLSGADLRGTQLIDADLSNTDLSRVISCPVKHP